MAETDSHIDAYMKLVDDISGILRLTNKSPDPCAMITVSFTILTFMKLLMYLTLVAPRQSIYMYLLGVLSRTINQLKLELVPEGTYTTNQYSTSEKGQLGDIYIDIFSCIDLSLLPRLLSHLKISGRVYICIFYFTNRYIHIRVTRKPVTVCIPIAIYISIPHVLYSIDHLMAHAFVPL